MLGFGPLGHLALGQLETPTGVARGAILELNITITAGTASGEGQQQPPVVVGIYRRPPWHQDAVAKGALLRLRVSLLPGRVTVSAAARGAVLPLIKTGIVEAGTATGADMITYDNDWLLLDIAA